MADIGVPKQLRAAVRYYVQLEAADYSYLTPILYDVRLENININGIDAPIYVDHRDYGYNIRTNVVPTNRETLIKIVGRVYAETGRPLNEQYPIQDTYIRLRNGALLRFATAMVIGGTGTGKTTLLNALLVLLPHKRLAIAEETPEIRVPPSFKNVVMLFTSPMKQFGQT